MNISTIHSIYDYHKYMSAVKTGLIDTTASPGIQETLLIDGIA
jgi:hypothetical protein